MARKPTTESDEESDARSTNVVDRHLGQRVRDTRLERQMSQEVLAGILGITFQQVQKYEKGANRMAASRLYDIALAFQVPVGYFFKGLVMPGEDAVMEVDQSRREAIARQIIDHTTHIAALAGKLSD